MERLIVKILMLYATECGLICRYTDLWIKHMSINIFNISLPEKARPGDPLYPFRQFYNAADDNLDDLIAIR